ncbi:MAG: putative DNA binding domain-containing protein [Prevotellaceae bacterium]|nr:putative DNA binding domain-containing protein [Prevotellaceae bacterium]
MALAINTEDLLNKQKIESNRIEFKKGWNPASIYHSVCAFANDFDDLGGGYIIVGVDTDDKTGMAIRPVEGMPMEKIDGILQEMVGYNNKIAPYYLPRTSVEEVDGKQVIVIWCPAGSYRPYSVPVNVTAKGSKAYFYIRSGTSSIEAKGEALVELRELANRVPFDERGNREIQLEDISLVLLRDHLVKVGSRLADDVARTPLPNILDQMELYTGPKENRLIRNVTAMMFCENPSKFFPYTQIDIVTFPNGKMRDPNNFTEVTFKGSVPQMIRQTMDYIKSNVLKENVRKISGRQEADRFWNYPYDAIEEAVVNSVYHRDFLQHEPIEITIEPEGISILNCPGPDRSISKEDIEKGDMLKSRRYRNRRLGDFLKELDLTEGRSTGVPTIQAKLAENGSPRAVFETTDDRLTFLVTIPVHEGCCESSETTVKSSGTGSGTRSKSSETADISSGRKPKSSERKPKSSERVLDLIRQKPSISAAEIAMMIDMSSRGVEKQIKRLREDGIIRRIGADFGGYWEIITEENE